MLTDKEVIDLYQSGMSTVEIYKKFGVNPGTISLKLKRNGVETRKKYVDMEGKEIGAWKVIEIDKNTYGKGQRWICLCRRCNTLKSVSGCTIRSGQTTKCRSCRTKERFSGYDEITSCTYQGIKSNAIQRNIKFDLSPQFLMELFEKQNRICPLSGTELYFPPPLSSDCKLGNASLDRIDSLISYEPTNVRWVYKPINQIRWDISDEIFLYFVDKIAKYQHQDINIEESDPYFSVVYWSRVKRAAEIRNISFNISMREMIDKIKSQNYLCRLSGEPIFINRYHRNGTTASLDRIDSKKGYNQDNVQWLHKTVNYMKTNFDQNYFIDLCKKISSYQEIKGKD